MTRRRFLSFEKILPLRWDSNPLAPGPRPRSTVSDSHAATELPSNPVSLLKNSCVPTGTILHKYVGQGLVGLGNTPLEILGIFTHKVQVDDVFVSLKFCVVKDYTMKFPALLGRNFMTIPNLKVELGDQIKITFVEVDDSIDDAIQEILSIDVQDIDSQEKCTVKVNENLSLESQSEIRNFVNGSYLEGEKFNDPEISYEMSISLKEEEPI
jgi:hypothetical protein